MGQIISSIDQAGVNALFLQVFNAIPDQNFTVNRSANIGPAQLQLQANCRLRAVDQPYTAGPIDLLGSNSNPPIKYQNLPLRLEAELRGTLNVGRWSRQVMVPASAEIALAGGARLAVQQQSQAFEVSLTLDASGTTVNMAGNRDAFVNAVRDTLEDIDISPWPGQQRLPGQVINSACGAAGQAIDGLMPIVNERATELLRARIGEVRVAMGYPIPRQFQLQVPGGGMVQVHVTNVVVAVSANQITLTATFA